MARVRAFAKLNLCLEVLNRRPDGFHNLRTIFQTISLHDTIDIEVRRSKSAKISLESNVEIPGENLITRAANAVLEAAGVVAYVRFRLKKRIPMGGGLGGGSTDAAAVLIALPSLLRKSLPPERLMELGAALGSDVPFFLIGGTAAGLGRGTELYPLPDVKGLHGLLIAPLVHVATADAYRSLNRSESYQSPSSATERMAHAIAAGRDWTEHCLNDFESAVFERHPELSQLRTELEQRGALAARMTGSGAALFGLFASEAKRDAAAKRFTSVRAIPFRFLSRRRSLPPIGR